MTTKKTRPDSKGTWVTYRPDIKVLDCTVRDGGLINNHNFEDSFVKAVYDTCVAAGIDYMEIGYKGSKELYLPTEHGKWKHCTEDDMRRIVGDNPTDLKLSAMADADRCDYHNDILPKDQSVLDMIRVACYINQIPTAIDMVKDATDKGYETCVNIMSVSTVQEKDLLEALEVLAETPRVYNVDGTPATGSFYVSSLADPTTDLCQNMPLDDRQVKAGFNGDAVCVSWFTANGVASVDAPDCSGATKSTSITGAAISTAARVFQVNVTSNIKNWDLY